MAKRQHANPHPVRLIGERTERVVERPATAARAEFFQLLETVTTDPTQVVLISHRGSSPRGALVSEEYLAYVRQLERLVADLMAERSERTPFRLCGTAELRGDLDEAIAAVRASDGDGRAARRFADL